MPLCKDQASKRAKTAWGQLWAHLELEPGGDDFVAVAVLADEEVLDAKASEERLVLGRRLSNGPDADGPRLGLGRRLAIVPVADGQSFGLGLNFRGRLKRLGQLHSSCQVDKPDSTEKILIFLYLIWIPPNQIITVGFNEEKNNQGLDLNPRPLGKKITVLATSAESYERKNK